jgi:predicted anti-sigma-YlaC factor YlaD
MTCRELIALLAEYLEASCDAEAVRALEEHLRDCRPCVAYLNTYVRTRDVTARANRVEMPEEMKTRLRSFLLERLRRATP